jgi:site-specific DNA-methyltransferase (adenine-specific)
MSPAPFTLEVMQDEPAVVDAPPCCGSLDLRLCDCMELMKEYPDKHFDLAVVDPPYGINVADNHKEGMGRRKGEAPASYKMGDWDSSPPPMEYFVELRRVSKEQIVWGANHFIAMMAINSPCWLIWNKKFSNDVSFAAGELAWTSFKSPAKMFECHPMQDGRIHPTQKPVALYKWILANYAKPGQRVLDTHLGSGSIAIAAHYAGVHLTACEIDADYYEAAKERIARETAQQELWILDTADSVKVPA